MDYDRIPEYYDALYLKIFLCAVNVAAYIYVYPGWVEYVSYQKNLKTATENKEVESEESLEDFVGL